MTEKSATPLATKTIPYTVTVNGGATRATVDGDNQTLRFATGDKLYIYGTNVKGVLDITSGVGETTGATFSGDLTVNGGGTVDPSLSLTATLVSAQQTVGTEVSVSESGAVTVNYPTTAYCADVATAVQKYSRLTGTSTYSEKSFSLSQQTAFLNFIITFEDGTTIDTELSAEVNNGGSAIATANIITTTESEKVVAKFVLPVASGTTLNSATVKMGDKEAISFGESQTLAAKVYNVKRTQRAAATPLSLTSPAVGQVIGSDGLNYDAGSLPTGVTAVAMIAYLGDASDCTNGLALQLNSSPESMKWADAMTYAEGLNTSLAFSGGTWRLPSMDDWRNMLEGCAVDGDASYFGPIYGFKAKIAATGITWKSGQYWSSRKSGVVCSYANIELDGSDAKSNLSGGGDGTYFEYYALGCLAF